MDISDKALVEEVRRAANNDSLVALLNECDRRQIRIGLHWREGKYEAFESGKEMMVRSGYHTVTAEKKLA